MSVAVGDTRSLVIADDLTRTQIVQYAGASGDYNPLHTDDRVATEVARYASIRAHGMSTRGMAARVLTDCFGPEAVLEYGARFFAQGWPGDQLTATAVVTECAERGAAPVAVISSDAVVLPGTSTVHTEDN